MTEPSRATGLKDIAIMRMSEHDLLEVVEIEEQSGLSRWGWAAYYAELQSGNRELMLDPHTAQPVKDNALTIRLSDLRSRITTRLGRTGVQ